MTLTAEVASSQLAELIKKIQSGHEVVLTIENKAVARIVPAAQQEAASFPELQLPTFPGHRVLTPVITGEDLAEDLFSRHDRP